MGSHDVKHTRGSESKTITFASTLDNAKRKIEINRELSNGWTLVNVFVEGSDVKAIFTKDL